jgi:8-oxo-dGTP diphosphatase
MKEIIMGNIRVVLDETVPIEEFDAVVVVLFSSDRLVLVKNHQRGWEFPGGHRESGESYEDVAVREAFEEAGARIKDVTFLGHYGTNNGQTTVITCADLLSLKDLTEERTATPVGIFDKLPFDLSFTDGREQLFLDWAETVRLKRQRRVGDF